MSLTGVLDEVYSERGTQDEKWGEQNHDDFIWSAVLGEEFGEVCQAALKLQFGKPFQPRSLLRDELIQVAAVAVAWAEAIDRRNG